MDTPGPETLLKGFFLFLKMAHKIYSISPGMSGTLMTVTIRTQMTSFTTCSWLPFHTQTYTEIQIIKGHFYTPSTNHTVSSTLLSFHFRFQRILRILILPISGKNSL